MVPALSWLWRRLAATAAIPPLAWDPPYAADAALQRQKKERKEGRKEKRNSLLIKKVKSIVMTLKKKKISECVYMLVNLEKCLKSSTPKYLQLYSLRLRTRGGLYAS